MISYDFVHIVRSTNFPYALNEVRHGQYPERQQLPQH